MEAAGIESDSGSEPDSANPHGKPLSRAVTGPHEPTLTTCLPSTHHPDAARLTSSGAPVVPEDPDLASVNAAWPYLSQDDRQRILSIATGIEKPC